MKKMMSVFFVSLLLVSGVAQASEAEYQTVTVDCVSVDVPADWEMVVFSDNGNTGQKYETDEFGFMVAIFDSLSDEDLSEYDSMTSITQIIDDTFSDYEEYTVVDQKDLSETGRSAILEVVTTEDYGYEITDMLYCTFNIEVNTAMFIRAISWHSYDSSITAETLDAMNYAIESLTFSEEDGEDNSASSDAYETLQSEYDALQESYNELLKEYNALKMAMDVEAETENESESETEVESEDPDAPEYDISATVNSVTESTFTVTTSKGNVYTFVLGDYELNIGETVSFKYKGAISSSYDIQPGTVSELEVTAEASETAKYETGITYDNLARNPDDYKYEYVKFSGEVVQTIEEDDSSGMSGLRLAVGGDNDQIIYCLYYDDILDYRILEDDEITIYGMSFGLVSYTATLGNTITIPCVYVEQVDQ